VIAGLPISALGGIFYLLLALYMPIHEVWMLVTGRSSVARWRRIGIIMGMLSGVLVAVYAQARLIAAMMPEVGQASSEALGLTGANQVAESQTMGLIAGSTMVAVTTLCLVFLLVFVLRVIVRTVAAVKAVRYGAQSVVGE
jgi:hypothetical protein